MSPWRFTILGYKAGFAQPWFLLGILVALLLGLIAIIVSVRRGTRVKKTLSPRLAPALTPGVSVWLPTLQSSSYTVALIFFAFALAQPQCGEKAEVAKRRGIDVVVALDVSKSMLARDVAPSRIERAKAELERLLDEEPGDRVGVVLFAGETMEYPLTTDHEAATRFFRDAHPWEFPVQGTSVGRAITAGLDLLKRDPLAARRSRVILVITDGEDLDGDPVAAAREAATEGVRVYLDAIGSAAPEPIPAYSPDGRMVGYERDSRGEVKQTQFTPQMEQQLRAVAQAGNGAYFHPTAGEVGIDAVRRQLASLRRADIAETQQTVYEELLLPFLIPAFVLLVVATALVPERVRRAKGAKA